MNHLEKEAYSDGFRILLLGSLRDRGAYAMSCRACLFDGGRARQSVQVIWSETSCPGRNEIADLRRLLVRVMAPPHVLAVYGNAWNELLERVFGRNLPDLRILDLCQAAAALSGLPGNELERIAETLGVETVLAGEVTQPALYEEVLWGTIAAAGKRGFTWKTLLELPRKTTEKRMFSSSYFDAGILADLPSAPGVYVMTGDNSRTLYVGKAANLKRRVADYFRTSRRLSGKVARLRNEIRQLEWQTAGSELEALLLEHELIAGREPEFNVQTRVAEGSSRYSIIREPVVVICPSAREDYREMFAFSSRPGLLQATVQAHDGTDVNCIETVIRWAKGGDECMNEAPSTCCLHGAEARELCYRYWARYRHRLTWTSLDAARSASDYVADIQRIIADVDDRNGAEFRLGT